MSGLTLESVEEAFRQWRLQRSSRKEPIPEALWSMALGLYPQYMRSKICHYLRLSGAQLKRRLEDDGGASRANGFVLATPQEEVKKLQALATQSAPITMVVTGTRRTLELSVDIDSLEAVLPHIGSLL